MENKKNKRIDLVVPCYKALPTLSQLLCSVAFQTIANKIQVILVQDCDGENYDEIIKYFSSLLDIKLVKLEENGGPGKSRRIGTENGESDYIIYADSDDTFQNPFAVEELFNLIDEKRFDAVNSVFLEELKGLKFSAHENDWVWVFGKIYRRSFLEKNKIEFNDSRANEDTGFNALVEMIGNNGYLLDTTYIWRYNEKSITRIDDGIYHFGGKKGWLYNMKYAIENMERLNVEEHKIKSFISNNIIACYRWYIQLERDRQKDERINLKEYVKWINEYYNDVYVRYKPEKEVLDFSYREQRNKEGFVEGLPSISFEEFLDIVGEGYDG